MKSHAVSVVYMTVSNAKIRRSTDSVDLLYAIMTVPCIQMNAIFPNTDSSTCVHHSSTICNIHIKDNHQCFNHILVLNATVSHTIICICSSVLVEPIPKEIIVPSVPKCIHSIRQQTLPTTSIHHTQHVLSTCLQPIPILNSIP